MGVDYGRGAERAVSAASPPSPSSTLSCGPTPFLAEPATSPALFLPLLHAFYALCLRQSVRRWKPLAAPVAAPARHSLI